MTAKSVLNTPRQVLLDKSDLEENTIDEVLEILRSEYEDDDEGGETAPEGETETETEDQK